MNRYGRQRIEDDDIEAVLKVLKSDYLTTGPEVDAFEQEFARKVGAKHAVAVANGTAALHLAMLALSIGKGDRVVTSPNTFLASANCAAYVGAIPDFCDIEPISYNLSPELLEANWKADTKAVVAVDYAGQPANMPEIARIARQHGAWVIEDASHGTGTSFGYDGQSWSTGSHPWADLTVFSLHPVKTITTGEGGVITTDNVEWAERLRRLRHHGILRTPEHWLGLGSSDEAMLERGPWYHEMQDLGYNYRITDFQCALGRSQLRKLDRFISRRLEIVERYNELFSSVSRIQTPGLADWFESASNTRISWHLYTLQIDFESLGMTRTALMKALSDRGIGTQVLYIPVHLQPWYRQQYGYGPGKCLVAEQFYTQALSLPLHPSLSDADVETIAATVIELTEK